jgi:hypothetical protein
VSNTVEKFVMTDMQAILPTAFYSCTQMIYVSDVDGEGLPPGTEIHLPTRHQWQDIPDMLRTYLGTHITDATSVRVFSNDSRVNPESLIFLIPTNKFPMREAMILNQRGIDGIVFRLFASI